MIKKTVQYFNLDDEQVEEDLYFHLSKADLAKMAITENGLEDRLRKMIEADDKKAIVEELERIIKLAYGRRSEDGKDFIRDEEASERFIRSEAYSALFISLFTDEKACAEFITGIVPKDLGQKVTQQMTTVNLPEDTRPAWEREGRPPTEQEVRGMSREELQAAFRMRANLPAQNQD